ncbi:MAG TPA: MOSC domain-containing protein [Methylomirabilota bacterium]|nr:MOSC domain-containing protein [Methylomirabilota bacterium]
MSKGTIVQLSVSKGGVPKLAVPEAQVTHLGLAGDAHRDLEHHGGPERAVCLFPLETIHALVAEGHTIMPGAAGENVTTEGLDWSLVVPDTRLLLGERVLLQVTKYTSPCFNIAPLFLDRNYGRISQKRHPGWSRVYARVLLEGRVRAGDPVRIVSEVEAGEVRRTLRGFSAQ